jgi:hypothetical protein
MFPDSMGLQERDETYSKVNYRQRNDFRDEWSEVPTVFFRVKVKRWKYRDINSQQRICFVSSSGTRDW